MDCRESLPLALVVMTPAPTKPTPDATLDAMRDGSHLALPRWEKPILLQIVKAQAPKATRAMVRTPALCLCVELRSLPTQPPKRDANKRRFMSFNSTPAGTGASRQAQAVLVVVAAIALAVVAAKAGSSTRDSDASVAAVLLLARADEGAKRTVAKHSKAPKPIIRRSRCDGHFLAIFPMPPLRRMDDP